MCDASSSFERGKTSFDNRDYPEAQRQFTIAESMDPTNPEYPAWLALTYQLSGNHAEARAAIARSIAAGGAALAYFVRGNLRDNEDAVLRVLDYTTAIKLDPAFAPAYYSRASAWRSQGDFVRAVADYTRAIELDPEESYAYDHPGNAMSEQGLLDQAQADLARAVELNATDRRTG